MAQIKIKYNPYKLSTDIFVDGIAIENDSLLHAAVKGKRLQEYITDFPEKLVKSLNCVNFEIEFYGMDLDWDDFNEAFAQAEKKGIVKSAVCRHTASKSNADEVQNKIIKVFRDLQAENAPIDDFRNTDITKKFNSLNEAVFPINIIGTMSAGKSTLINSMLSRKLMPSKNQACTAIITEILDNDSEIFTAKVRDKDDNILGNISDLTLEEMTKLNDDKNVRKIEAKGNIPFLDADNTALKFVDTPGTNNAQYATEEEKDKDRDTTYETVERSTNNLIIYILNATQLGTKDDATLLEHMSEQIKEGTKQQRDKFLFVINKLDEFKPDEGESPNDAIDAAKRYLANHGIDDPQIFPVSASTALNIRTFLKDIDINNLTRADEKKLPSAARETLTAIDLFNDFEEMHLEKYSTLAPSAQNKLNYMLSEAEKNNDTKEQALIHCGIYSLESAITAYVKKYSQTQKVTDLVGSFRKTIDKKETIARIKNLVAENEEAAKECSARAAAVRDKIADGSEAIEFKDKVAKLDPIPTIEKQVKDLNEKLVRSVSKVFKSYGDVIYSRDDASRIINTFNDESKEQFAKFSSNAKNLIKKEIIDSGNSLLEEYKIKLQKIDDSVSDTKLDFRTADLVNDSLSNMIADVEKTFSSEFANELVEEQGETYYEEKEYYEKVGQEAVKEWAGKEEQVVGTKKVKVGSHRERVGTKSVANPKRSGFFGKLKFWQPKYIEEDVYEYVDDYEEREIIKEVDVYKTVMRDVFEKRVEKIEKYQIETSKLQTALLAPIRLNLKRGLDEAIDYSKKQVEDLKEQFTDMFDKLDEIIKKEYDNLEKFADKEKISKEEYERNKKILEWLEANSKEIDDILDI